MILSLEDVALRSELQLSLTIEARGEQDKEWMGDEAKKERLNDHPFYSLQIHLFLYPWYCLRPLTTRITTKTNERRQENFYWIPTNYSMDNNRLI